MDNLPQPFWAILLAIFGLILALAVLFAPGTDNIRLAVLAIASSLVSGALGAFAAHNSAVKDARDKPTGAPTTGATFPSDK